MRYKAGKNLENLTNLEYALLGLIGLSPLSGYDVHKIFATTPLAHFSSSPGAIYPALRRLARRGLLAASLDRTKEARPRRIYTLTMAGEKTFEAWLRQPVTRDELVRGSGAPILRFALAQDRLSKDEVLAYLGTYKSAVADYVAELHGHAVQMEAPGQLHGRLALDNGIRAFRSDLAWVKSAEKEIKRTGPKPRARKRRPLG